MPLSVKAKWPEGVALINKFYAFLSPVIYVYQDAKGNVRVRIIWSTCGTRQGCVIGSLGFDIVMDPIYKFLDANPRYESFLIG